MEDVMVVGLISGVFVDGNQLQLPLGGLVFGFDGYEYVTSYSYPDGDKVAEAFVDALASHLDMVWEEHDGRGGVKIRGPLSHEAKSRMAEIFGQRRTLQEEYQDLLGKYA